MTEYLDNVPLPGYRERLLLRSSWVAAWVVAAIGMLVLFGWLFDVAVLKSVMPSFANMKPNTALAFLLMGTATAQLHRSRSAASRRTIQVIALVVALIGALTVAEYVLGWNPNIDEFLFRDSEFKRTPFHGRMSIIAALNFALMGSALMILSSRHRALQRLGDVVTNLALFSSMGTP